MRERLIKMSEKNKNYLKMKRNNSWNLLTECPQCKLWGENIDELKRCPECGLEFSSRVRERMIGKGLLEDVVFFVFNGFFESLWRVIEAWKNEHTVFTERDIKFKEALMKLLNPENEYSANDGGDNDRVEQYMEELGNFFSVGRTYFEPDSQEFGFSESKQRKQNKDKLGNCYCSNM